jgi:acyl carrier protein
MGYFNNLVPLHVEVRPDEPFTGLVERLKAIVVEGFSCPDVPLEQLAAELASARGAGGTILYQALFSFQDARQRVTRWGGLTHSPVPLFQRGATEDLGMWFVETGKGMHGGVTYNTDILASSTAKDVHGWFLKLLELVVAQPGATVAALLGPAGAGVRRKEPAAVPASAHPAPAAPAAGAQPTTETEKLLASIWREQLKIEHVGTQDNFFDLGGHSLLAMQAILAMESRTGKRVDRGRFIFESLGQIARAYDEAKPEPKQGGLRGLLSGLLGGKKP